MKILEIGPGSMPVAHLVWPEKDHPGRVIETVEAVEEFDTTYHFDARTPPEKLNGKYDAVLASHVFEHIFYGEAEAVLKRWVDLLKPGGQMHIIVPAAEWVALQLMLDKPSPVLQAQLHGLHTTEYDVHRASYTLRAITRMFRRSRLAVTHAATDEYKILWGDQEFIAQQHYIKGIKLSTVEVEK